MPRMRSLFGCRAILVCATALLLFGCTETQKEPVQPAASGTVDEHDQPADYAAAVAALQGHYEKIKVAFESGSPDDAHEPLHEIGHVLEAIPDLATAELAADQAEKVNQAKAELFEAYGQVDDAMHKGETPDYAAVAEKIDTNIAVIEKAVPDRQ